MPHFLSQTPFSSYRHGSDLFRVQSASLCLGIHYRERVSQRAAFPDSNYHDSKLLQVGHFIPLTITPGEHPVLENHQLKNARLDVKGLRWLRYMPLVFICLWRRAQGGNVRTIIELQPKGLIYREIQKECNKNVEVLK